MLNKNIIRAWKDKDYFESLSQQEQVRVPENPAGMLELSEEDMENFAGGHPVSQKNCSYGCQLSADKQTCYSFLCRPHKPGKGGSSSPIPRKMQQEFIDQLFSDLF